MSKYVMIGGERVPSEALTAFECREMEILHKGAVETDREGNQYVPVEGAVLVPESIDKQDHIVSGDEIKEAAHVYMMYSQMGGEKHERKVPRSGMVLVESHLSKGTVTLGETEVPEGTWIVKYRVYDAELMEKILKGDYAGFSIGGYAGKVIPEEVPV